jgi:hypothetical protein
MASVSITVRPPGAVSCATRRMLSSGSVR